MGTSASKPTPDMASKHKLEHHGAPVIDDEVLLIDKLKNAVIRNDENNAESPAFLPDCELMKLLSEHEIRLELEGDQNLRQKEGDISEVVRYIRERAPKTFAILVYIGYTEWMYGLWKSGFTDEMLPIASGSLLDILSRGELTPQQVSRRSLAGRVGYFEESQWIFTALAFDLGTFHYGAIDHRKRIPFMRKVLIDEGGFSIVWRTVVHKDYLVSNDDRLVLDKNYFVLRKKSKNMQPLSAEKITIGDHEEVHPLLALKELRTLSKAQSEEIGIKDSKSEANILEVMNDIDHPHLIHTIAHYTQNGKDYFLFPFATRGSLRKYWDDTTLPVVDAGYVRWLIGQMLGLAEAIRGLHRKKCRHGDLKPENILCFSTGGTGGDLRLVIADVGLAKIHAEITAQRHNTPTTTKAGTVMYSPPEYEYPNSAAPWSRLFDVWSLGCIFLEFMVWTLEGPSGLAGFRRSIAPENAQRRTFYTTSESKESVQLLSIRSDVTGRVEKLLKDKRCQGQTGLRRVLRLIADNMMVVALPEDGAAEAEEMAAIEPNSSVEDDEDTSNTPTAHVRVSASEKGPSVVIQRPTAIESEDNEKRRSKANDLVEKLQKIIKEIDDGITPALAPTVKEGKARSPLPRRQAHAGSTLGIPKPGRNSNQALQV